MFSEQWRRQGSDLRAVLDRLQGELRGPTGTGSGWGSGRFHGSGMEPGAEAQQRKTHWLVPSLALSLSGQVRFIIQGPILSSTRTAGPGVQSPHNRLRKKGEPGQHEACNMENVPEKSRAGKAGQHVTVALSLSLSLPIGLCLQLSESTLPPGSTT